jgi:hypothetical protein
VGKANLRIGKFGGSSNDLTGLPGSYTSNNNTVIDPSDANITWNATTGMWEVTFDVTGFSGFVIQTSIYVLPVHLLSFDAQVFREDVRLSWKTADELNHDHFEVERSTDGSNFTPVASIAPIPGAGVKSYAHTDAGASLLNASKVYYRLKMVSTAGIVEYSHIVIVNVTPPSSPVTRVGPNPFHNKLEVGLYMPESQQLAIQLTDLYGRRIVQQSLQAPKGFSTYSVDKSSQLKPGVYMLTVVVGEQLYSFKVLKQ